MGWSDLLPQMIGGSSFSSKLLVAAKSLLQLRAIRMGATSYLVVDGVRGVFWKVSDRTKKGVLNSSPVRLVEVTHESCNRSLGNLPE